MTILCILLAYCWACITVAWIFGEAADQFGCPDDWDEAAELAKVDV